MLEKHIQVPYIKTILGLVTPALIISATYLLVLAVLLIIAKKKGTLKTGIVEISKLMQGDKNKIIISMVDALTQYFDKKVNELSSDFSERHRFQEEFADFFEKLQDADDLTLTENQIKRLHQLVSKIVEQFSVPGIWYRRIILKIPVRNN